MKTRINQLLRGEFEYETPELLFSQDKVYVTVRPGETAKGEVYLGTDEDRKIRGYITSSDRRLVPGFSSFSGTTIRLPYGVDGIGMEPGEKRTEWLCFTTSIGEYRLPFVIETAREKADTSSGEITSLTEFAELARQDFREAHRVFTSPGFKNLLKTCKGSELAAYAALTEAPVTYRNVEEFLVSLGLKEKVEISLSDYRRELYEVSETVSDSVTITRSGWGHLRLEIETEGDFIEGVRSIVSDDDFIGSTYTLDYVINRDKLGKGNRFGKIRINSAYQTLTFEIEASRDIKAGPDVRMSEKKRRLGIYKDYIDYRTGKADISAWIVGSRYELNRLKEAGCDYSEYILYESYLLLQEGKIAEAKDMLVRFRDRSYAKEDLEIAGVYLYLCTVSGLYKDRQGALQRIRGFYRQKEDSLWLLLILITFDPEFTSSPSAALTALENLFNRGVRSPLMYLAALDRIRKDESLLRRLNIFWMQVFLFGVRYDYLTEELAMRFAYLSGYERQYSECLYRALSGSYRLYPSDDTLEAICRHIMIDNPRRRDYFQWYDLAVHKGIRLTRLYEYYMETLDISYRKPLPRPVLMYFNYNNSSMGDARKAYIYATVTENREADPASFSAYREAMDEFARDRLAERKISEDMTILYRNFIPVPEKQEEAEDMASICFCRRLYCDDRNMRTVIVRHRQLVREEVYPLVRGVCYPKIYTKDAAVLFADFRQRRSATSKDYSMNTLLDDRLLVPRILSMGVETPGLLLSYCESHEITDKNLKYFRSVVNSDEFTDDYRNEIRKRILKFYRSDMRGESMDLRLKEMDLRAYATVDRRTLLEVLVMRGHYTEAYQIVEEFGTEGLDASMLLRLTSRMILKSEMKEDEELVALASEVYKNGTYDELILKYLMEHRFGPVDDLIRIMKSARGFDLDTYSFEEKILSLLMLTQDYRKEGESILEHYAEMAGKERIIGAYLTQLSYGYLVKDYNITPYTRKILERSLRYKWPVDRICRYALLKALVREKDPRGRYDGLKKELVEECRKRGYIFSFFRRLPESLLSLYQLDDKTFVECHADPKAKVTLYYLHESGLTPETEYRSKPVPLMYEGIFSSVFTLFYGETLKYYFEIEENGTIRKTGERTIRMNKAESGKSSKYHMINRLLASHMLGKDKETVTGLRQYLRQQQYVEQMFVPEKAEKPAHAEKEGKR